MIASLKSELQKIWTVRSTYLILLFSFGLMCIFAFWIEGVKAGESSKAITDPTKLASLISDAITNLAFWGGLVGILSATHEYRYNTIMYTLTSSRSRTKTLFAKVFAVAIFAVVFTVFVAVMAPIMMYLGLAVKGFSLTHQVIPTDLWWRVLFEGWGMSMLGLLLAILIRVQVGAIAAFFVIPVAIEPLAGLLLKENRAYLPFLALQQVTGLMGSDLHHVLSHSKAAMVVCAYLVVGWIVAWILFLKRDAS
ncbi:MAG TPA: ABC transporter permease [Candidatus Saccharimonadales bacterium]|nr:ABC transporter permease [Candidatus Saccharimonadales bacterium]